MQITLIRGNEIFDSRGYPTIEVEVYTEGGVVSRAGVPSGASTGEREAIELRDGDKKYFDGKGVSRAINNINKLINDALVGEFILDQGRIDQKLIEIDGTKNKRRLGANAIVGVSMAVAKCAADSLGIELFRYIGGIKANTLPIPMFNLINGGKHAENTLDFQEFMVVPLGAKSFREALVMGSSIFHKLKEILKQKGYSTGLGDEGGFAPSLKSHKEALDLLVMSIERAGWKPGVDCFISLDIAASTLWDKVKRKYVLKHSNNGMKSTDGMIKLYGEYIKKYPILSIEDPLSEEDWEGWQYMYKEYGDEIIIIGDDLVVTNPEIIEKAIEKSCINGVIIKLNQIGTVTEAMEAVRVSQLNGLYCVVSHRSGETTDTFISDFAVGVGAHFIKTGAPSRGERMAKYNRLLAIENILGERAYYMGKFFLE